jgi:Na+-driven multidrug efflux pump
MLFLILSALPDQNTEVIAAFTNGLRIEAAIFLPAFALNMANAVIVGNFLGERRFDNAYKSGLTTALIGVMIISVMTAMVIFNARSLSAFLSKNGLVVNESVRYLYISMISEPVMAWAVILGGALNGAGDTRGVMAIVIGSQWLVRLPLAYLTSVVFMLGPSAVWWSMNASILVHAVFITMRYRKRRWLDDAN